MLFRAAHHSASLELELSRRNIPFVKYGGLKFVETAHVKDLVRVPAPGREPARRGGGAPRAAARCRASGRATASGLMGALRGRGGDFDVLGVVARRPEAAAGTWPDFVTLMRNARAAHPRARSPRSSTPRACSTRRLPSSATTTRRRASPTSSRSRRSARASRTARGSSRSSRSTRPTGRATSPAAPARRGLPHPLDDPLGQGARVGRRVRDPRGRRQHPVRHGDRKRRGDRRGAPAVLRGVHARQGAPLRHASAALLRGRSRDVRRLRLRAANPLHTRPAAAALRRVTGASRGGAARRGGIGRSRQRRASARA